MEVSQQLDYILTQEMLNNKQIVTKKWFREGEIIDKRFVRMKPDVERNSEVQAYFKSNGVMIMVNGKALDDGMIGDYISVLNDKYKKTYKARVIGENKVLINI
jgi:flagella basal body P-ring formation protein FlgA